MSEQLTSAPIATVAVVTCDRTEALRRCAASYARGARDCGRRIELVVFDDSRSDERRAHNRAALAAVAIEHAVSIRYSARSHRADFAAALAGRGRVAGDLTSFALEGRADVANTCGANRNAVLLDTVGAPVLMVDDDTLWRVADVAALDGVVVDARPDLGELWFFDDLHHALRAVPQRSDVDMPGIHEVLLGRRVTEILARMALAGSIPAAVAARMAAGEPRVRVTQMGVVGDIGASSPLPYLLLEGRSRDRLLASEDVYRAACTGRAAMRRVARCSVSASDYCMAYVLGLDNRDGLVPFFPFGRNSDGVFASVLRANPDWLLGQVPYAVAHAPPEVRRWCAEDAWAAPRQWRIADAARVAIAARPPAAAVGEWLIERATVDLPGFLRQQRAAMLEAVARRIRGCLERHQGQPRYWANDLSRALDCAESARGDDLPPPPDLPVNCLAATVLAQYGRLVASWPAIIDEVLALRADGIRISEPIEA